MPFQKFPGFSDDQNAWLYQVYQQSPELYRIAVAEYKKAVKETGVNGLAAWTDVFAKVATTVEKIAPSLVTLKKERDALKLQKEQIRADSAIRSASVSAGYGDPGASMMTANPNADIYAQYGVQNTGQRMYQAGGGSLFGISPALLMGGAALVMVFLFMRNR